MPSFKNFENKGTSSGQSLVLYGKSTLVYGIIILVQFATLGFGKLTFISYCVFFIAAACNIVIIVSKIGAFLPI